MDGLDLVFVCTLQTCRFYYYNYFDSLLPQEILLGLAERGHETDARGTIAVIQLITKEGNKIYATSDPRKSGHGADGY